MLIQADSKEESTFLFFHHFYKIQNNKATREKKHNWREYISLRSDEPCLLQPTSPASVTPKCLHSIPGLWINVGKWLSLSWRPWLSQDKTFFLSQRLYIDDHLHWCGVATSFSLTVGAYWGQGAQTRGLSWWEGEGSPGARMGGSLPSRGWE